VQPPETISERDEEMDQEEYLHKQEEHHPGGDDIQTRSALSRAARKLLKTFDTTAIKPQNPQQSETYIISAENATDKALNGLQYRTKTVLPRISKMLDLFVEAQRDQKEKGYKGCWNYEREEDEPDDNHFHEKLRHLWTMKRQAQEIQTVQGSNERFRSSERQSSAENSAAVPPKFQLALHRALMTLLPPRLSYKAG
jgi:hypothetical protein